MRAKGRARRELTRRQRDILDYIEARVQEDGRPPTQDEIKDAFGLRSAFGVRQHLRLISEKGYIELCQGKSRGIRILGGHRRLRFRVRRIPIVGRIAAGAPILAEEHVEDWIAIGDEIYPRGELFALRVSGDSMVKVGVNSGDLAVIRRQPCVENGEIGAVSVNGEVTLKRVLIQRDGVLLKAENDAVANIRIKGAPGSEIRVLGLYVGLIRRAR